MTLDKNDPLYKEALEHGLTEPQIESIVRYSGVDGLCKVVARAQSSNTQETTDDDGWQPEVVVETIGVDDGSTSCVAQGCYPIILTFVIVILSLGIADGLFGDNIFGPKHPVLGMAAFFVIFGAAAGLSMLIFNLTGNYVNFGWAFIKKNWWKALAVLWILSALASGVSALLPGDDTPQEEEHSGLPMPEPVQNPDPYLPDNKPAP